MNPLEQKSGRGVRGPLYGIRVLDLSRVLAGPFCGSILADLGADVIRIEHPTNLDEVRSWAPKVEGVSAPFAAVNYGKRGIVIDLANEEGRAVFLKLVVTADVLLENFRPGTLERLGLGTERLRDANPRVIHCALRAFPAGTSGERLPGYEASMQAYSGVMSVTGEHDGEPVRCGVSVIDLGTAMASVIAILSALRERDRTGESQYVEPALLRTATNFMNYQIAGYTLAGALPQRYGSGHEVLVPYRNFDCVDGAVLIAAGNDRLWARLCDALPLKDEHGAVRFATLAERIANRDAVNARVGAAVVERKLADVLEVLVAAGIPCAPVNTVAEYVSDGTLLAAGVLENVSVLEGRETPLAGTLFAADFLPHARRAPPRAGEHTREVLRTIGYTDDDVDALAARGAVGLQQPG